MYFSEIGKNKKAGECPVLAGMGATGTLFAARECERSAFPKGTLQIFNQIKHAYTLECRNLALNASTKSPEGDTCHVTIFSAAVPVVCWVRARAQIWPPLLVMEEVDCGGHPLSTVLPSRAKIQRDIKLYKASLLAQRSRIHLQCRSHRECGFDPWVEEIPWRRSWQPTPVLLPRVSHGQRSLVGYSS